MKNHTIVITCDLCPGEVPMECTKTIGTIESGKQWRQRWFTCPICGYEKKINGSGYHSETLVPHIIEKQFKRDNRGKDKPIKIIL